ncbi:centrosome-associated protein CEP250 [Nasonia vitripennis]|uniref:Uncharacterized protein n=1 Tax=Nasonia vitripennis TaxID=7425 RepID=A0A7M7TAN9_NASVI|nr:centrosome-associated protein CEP250 [Nasonia vitripennis]
MADEKEDAPVAAEGEQENEPQEIVEEAEQVQVSDEPAKEAENQGDEAQTAEARDVADDGKTLATEKSEETATAKDLSARGDKSSIYAPEYQLPPGLGEGIPVGPGQNRESIMSSVPVTESAVMQQMFKADERAKIVRAEIQELKASINELTNKDELSEEDTIILRDKQTEVMRKVGELNDITRKLQRIIGLVDPSTPTFAKMFELLPYPHTRGTEDEKEKSCENLVEGIKECERFAFPQIEYPEDKLPRVIVCGNTEDNIPKIVVPDSRPRSRGNKCIEKLTGRLSESLCLQDKLAKENAELEGGKYALERELLEKDNAVECLERKVRGLQDEMRFVVKENCELNRKLVCLQQQQQQQQQSCSSPCSVPSPRLSPKSESRCRSPRISPQPPTAVLDLSCKCSAREQSREQTAQPPVEASNACRNHSPISRRDPRAYNSPRLAGGASRGDDGFTHYQQNRQEMQAHNSYRNGISSNNGCAKSPAMISQGPARGGAVCPAEIDERLAAYGNNTKYLVEQLSCVENEVRTLQADLMNVQHERQQLEQQRKLLECANPCATCVCCPEPPKSLNLPPKNKQEFLSCSPCDVTPEANACAAQQLRDLREQYARLQDDYKDKLCEVSRQRADAEALKREAREAREERERMEIKLIDAQERSRAIEAERNELLGTKEQLIEQEQALLVARQRFREAQDELEELRTMIRDQAAQLDDYRNKYLQAQQQVEEQRRQLDLMEMDNARMNENVALEIGRVKNQFQEKLAEIAPLPDILKQTQMKLQETQQQRMLAEHNCEDLSRELLAAKDKIDSMQNQINDLQREIQNLQDEKNDGGSRIEDLEKKNGELRNENERLKNAIARFEEQQAVMQKRIDEKQHEVTQLTAMLEQVREDSARQVSRTKERCEAIKRSMQAQISDFEIQLAQCRAAAKTAQKERDEIRQKMQGQIGNLSEALQQAQGRIKSLQGHVEYLKVSYSNVFGNQVPGESTTLVPQTESLTGGQGYDSCDCNH